MDLQKKIAHFPRIPLGVRRTPLERLPRLSREMGREVWIKRDDLIGPAPGGNKARTLEFILGEAVAQGAKRLATFGATQSNHTRMTAAAGNRLGMETHIFCFETRPHKVAGNMLLNELYGAQVHFLPLGGAGGGLSLETTNRLVRWLARLMAGPNYFIPVGGHTWRGCLGYAAAAIELIDQTQDLGLSEATIVQPSGTGATLAGLMAGLKLSGSALNLVGIDVGKLWRGYPASIARLATELSQQLGLGVVFQADEIPLVEGKYVGPGYGRPSTAGGAALRKIARLESVLLDPIYTGKAFAGLLDLAEKDALPSDGPIIFLHTGGLPGIFAFNTARLGLQ